MPHPRFILLRFQVLYLHLHRFIMQNGPFNANSLLSSSWVPRYFSELETSNEQKPFTPSDSAPTSLFWWPLFKLLKGSLKGIPYRLCANIVSLLLNRSCMRCLLGRIIISHESSRIENGLIGYYCTYRRPRYNKRSTAGEGRVSVSA